MIDFVVPDAGVIERGQHLRLSLESRDPLPIVRANVREHLDCDFAIEIAVDRAIDLAHSAAAEPVHDDVRSDVLIYRQALVDQLGRLIGGCATQEVVHYRFTGQESIHFAPQGRVTAAGLLNEGRASMWISRHCGVEDRGDTRPLFGRHRRSSG